MSKFIDSAIVLAICTAILFSWSTAKYNGFLIVANLDSDMMERNFHQVIYNGLLLSFLPVLISLICISAILFFYSHLILPEYVNYVKENYKVKKKVVKFRKRWVGNRQATDVEKKEKKRFNKFIFFTFLGISFLFSLVYFEREGKELAKAILLQHAQNKNVPQDMINVSIEKNVVTLRFLGCGSRNCAGIEEKTNRIFYFPQSYGHSFVHQIKI